MEGLSSELAGKVKQLEARLLDPYVPSFKLPLPLPL